jgi:hypothetical protein
VAGDDGELHVGKFSLDGVEICVANATDIDADEDFFFSRFWFWDIGQFKGMLLYRSEFIEEHGFHRRFLL